MMTLSNVWRLKSPFELIHIKEGLTARGIAFHEGASVQPNIVIFYICSCLQVCIHWYSVGIA